MLRKYLASFTFLCSLSKSVADCFTSTGAAKAGHALSAGVTQGDVMGEELALRAPVLLHAPGRMSSMPVSVTPLLSDFSVYPLVLVLLRNCSRQLLVVTMSGFHLLSANFFSPLFLFSLPDNWWWVAGGKHLRDWGGSGSQ